ncbi:hypothetical protein ACMD2_22818 [Ananas comosus]|uniref:Phospholipase A2 family protein n=1 Tax=Ananas comosus TaxID=4615 RepID=A0A199VCJ6_ANACO|nr:hypothetical protein ACMD2_22818 [Ananas comosus]
MRDKPLWVPPTLNLHFLERLLPSPLKLLPPNPNPNPNPRHQTQISDPNPAPNPITPLAPLPQSPPGNATLGEFFATMTRSLQSVLPRRPPPVSRRRRADAGCAVPLFRPYVAKVPWHGGPRALLSQLFPRYGHYCGPNWSSGKNGGSMLWDQRPIDWLDFCCYCHDIGYDTYDQAKLLKADLAFLECLEKPRMATKGGANAALLYRAM